MTLPPPKPEQIEWRARRDEQTRREDRRGMWITCSVLLALVVGMVLLGAAEKDRPPRLKANEVEAQVRDYTLSLRYYNWYKDGYCKDSPNPDTCSAGFYAQDAKAKHVRGRKWQVDLTVKNGLRFVVDFSEDGGIGTVTQVR